MKYFVCITRIRLSSKSTSADENSRRINSYNLIIIFFYSYHFRFLSHSALLANTFLNLTIFYHDFFSITYYFLINKLKMTMAISQKKHQETPEKKTLKKFGKTCVNQSILILSERYNDKIFLFAKNIHSSLNDKKIMQNLKRAFTC